MLDTLPLVQGQDIFICLVWRECVTYMYMHHKGNNFSWYIYGATDQGPISLTACPSQFKRDGKSLCSDTNSNSAILSQFCTWHDSYPVLEGGIWLPAMELQQNEIPKEFKIVMKNRQTQWNESQNSISIWRCHFTRTWNPNMEVRCLWDNIISLITLLRWHFLFETVLRVS